MDSEKKGYTIKEAKALGLLKNEDEEIAFPIGQRFRFEKYTETISTGAFLSYPGNLYKDGTMNGVLVGYSKNLRFKKEIVYHIKLDNGYLIKSSTTFLKSSKQYESRTTDTYETLHDVPSTNDLVKNSLFMIDGIHNDHKRLVELMSSVFHVDFEYADIQVKNEKTYVFVKFSKWVALEWILEEIYPIHHHNNRFQHLKSH